MVNETGFRNFIRPIKCEVMNWNNTLKEQLNIQYPVIQAPMLGITTPAMVAQVSNAGGLGSLPVGGLSADATLQLITATKALTHRPFAVNLFVHELPTEDHTSTIAPMQSLLGQLAASHGISQDGLTKEETTYYTYHQQIAVLLAQQIRIVSFTFGIPDDASIAQLKSAGVYLIGTATCVEEAVLLESKGIDAIVAQGIEAGGHRGSFLPQSPLPQIGSMALIPLIADRVAVPVIAAGAIADGRSILAAKVLGAKGFQPGSIFLRSPESKASPAQKDATRNSKDISTQVTNTFTGRWARGITNSFMQTVTASGLAIPPYPVQNSLTATLRKRAAETGQTGLLSMWAGQRAAIATDQATRVIFEQLIADTEALAKTMA
jgi:nitronate monooxygenase